VFVQGKLVYHRDKDARTQSGQAGGPQ
jgi:hypothetical protein